MMKQFPQDLSLRQTKKFLDEVKKEMKVERPRLVLDCSHMRQVDNSVLYLLICCLEEAIKHNGDIKLAALPPVVANKLSTTGVSRLFEIFNTPAEAMNSFNQSSLDALSPTLITVPSDYGAESAA
jgi:anti-sigma B factor antagonist